MLRRLAERTASDMVTVICVRSRSDGSSIVSRAESEGSFPSTAAFYRGLEGQELRVPTWRPDLPARLEVNRFKTGLQETRAALGRTASGVAAYHRYYGQFEHETGTPDHARVLVYEGRRFLACVALVRGHGRVFRAEESAEFDREIVPLLRTRLAARAAVGTDLAEADAVLLFNAEGRLEHASESAERWLTRDRREHLTATVRHQEPEPGRACVFVLDRADGRIVRASGADGVRYVVTLSPTHPILLHPLADLSPRQRQVAALAADGASAPQIAENLSLSVHTVRQHLKVAYQTLAITNRVALAQIFERLH